MIDTERIIKAASDWQIRKNTRSTMRFNGFLEGAKWMQYALKQELWHHAAEEPKKGAPLLGIDADGVSLYKWVDQEPTWNEFCYNSTLKKWCYIGDILPDEEDGQ